MTEWNKTQEHFLQSLGEKAKAWDWLHHKSSLGLTWWNKWLSIANIFFNAVLTGLNASDLWGNPVLFNYIIMFASIIALFMSGVVKSLNYVERIENHRTAGHKFKVLANEIQSELAKRRKDRGDPIEIVHTYTDKFNNLLVDCPNVEEKILFRFTEIFKKDTFSKPELANEITNIEIKEESNNSSNKKEEEGEIFHEIDTSLQEDLEKALENKIKNEVVNI